MIAQRNRRTPTPGFARHYFPAATIVLLALTILGFSDNLFTNVGQESNADPKFIAHGLFCLAWMTLLAVQANLVGRGNIRLHRTLGMAVSRSRRVSCSAHCGCSSRSGRAGTRCRWWGRPTVCCCPVLRWR